MDLKNKHLIKSAFLILFIGILCVFVVFLLSKPNSPFPSHTIETEEDIQSFFAEYNLEIDINNIECKNSMLPKEFDTVFEEYNALQQSQNCDLKHFAGKEVQIYSIPITNYGTSNQSVYATLIVHNKKIIGGDIHSAELNGFMHTLR